MHCPPLGFGTRSGTPSLLRSGVEEERGTRLGAGYRRWCASPLTRLNEGSYVCAEAADRGPGHEEHSHIPPHRFFCIWVRLCSLFRTLFDSGHLREAYLRVQQLRGREGQSDPRQ